MEESDGGETAEQAQYAFNRAIMQLHGNDPTMRA